MKFFPKINFPLFFPMKVVHCIAGSTIKKHFHYIILMWLFCHLTIATILWRDYHLLTSMVFNQHWIICHQKRKGPTETRPLYLTHSDRMWVGICLSNPRHDNSINLSPKLLSPGLLKPQWHAHTSDAEFHPLDVALPSSS
jgi:hypothetical protein